MDYLLASKILHLNEVDLVSSHNDWKESGWFSHNPFLVPTVQNANRVSLLRLDLSLLFSPPYTRHQAHLSFHLLSLPTFALSSDELAQSSTSPSQTVRFLFRKICSSKEARISQVVDAGWTLQLRQQWDCGCPSSCSAEILAGARSSPGTTFPLFLQGRMPAASAAWGAPRARVR